MKKIASIAVLCVACIATPLLAGPQQQSRWSAPPVDCKPTLAAVERGAVNIILASEGQTTRDPKRDRPRERTRSTKPCVQLASA